MYKKACFVLSCLFLTSCAYRLGLIDRHIPGGYRQVAVPVFKNTSFETGIEVLFTNAMIRELERSQVARVSKKGEAEATLIGKIMEVKYNSTVGKTSGELPGLPAGTQLSSEYEIRVKVEVLVIRNSDHKVLWRGIFDGEQRYTAPQITIARLNSANPLYNQSARWQNMTLVAKSMMSEAHDQMTENF